MTVLITGATGFVGARLCTLLHQSKDWRLIGLGRNRPENGLAKCLDGFVEADLCAGPDLAEELKGVDVIIHLASRVHNMRETGEECVKHYRETNVVATRHLAEQALMAGVKRFVFVSTIKVNGEMTSRQPFSGDDQPAPLDAYARSKMEAENELLELARRSTLEVVILRPPLVYGPGVRANFLSLMRLASRGLPLPLGSIRNRRSLLYVDNLCDALAVAAISPAARNRIFTVADDDVVSTRDLIGKLSQGMGRAPRLWPFPVAALKGFASLMGMRPKMSRLVESLEADNSQFKRETGWHPKKSIDEGLRETAQWFLTQPR